MSTQFGDAKRTLSTGDLVISVSEIFDRLQTKVDPNTLEQLLRDILAGRRKQVRPGELITAELINQILAELESLEGRVIKLETAAPTTGGGTTEAAATGFIEVRYKGSTRGVQLVPGDTTAYPHTFTLANSTDKTLNIQLAASVTAPHGDWSNSVQILGVEGAPITSLSLATGATRDFIVSLRVPTGAQVADAAVLGVRATVGPPHNKVGNRDLPMTLAAAAGPAVTRSVTFNLASPPGGLSNVPVGIEMPFIFHLRYAAQTPPTATFKFTATLTANPPESIGDWFVDFLDRPRNPGTGPEAFSSFPLNTGDQADTRVTVRVRTPFTKAATEKTATLNVKVESTDANLTPAISATSGPFKLTLTKN